MLKVLLAMAAAGTALALLQPYPATFNAETRAVQTHVVVKDSDGHIVRGLKKDDFVLADNGKPRAIQFFSTEDGSPPEVKAPNLSPGVFSNRSGSVRAPHNVTAIVMTGPFEALADERNEVIQALEDMQPSDTIALYSCTSSLRVIQDYTSDRNQLLKGLKADWPPIGHSTPPPDPYYYLRTIAGHLASTPGRKRIIWLQARLVWPGALPWPPDDLMPSVGGVRGGVHGLHYGPAFDETVDVLNRAGIAFHLVAAGSGLTQSPATLAAERLMANELGGDVEYSGNYYHDAVEQALAEPLFACTMGFYLKADEREDKTHQIKLSIPGQPMLALQYSSKLTPPNKSIPSNDDPAGGLLSPVDSADVGIDASVTAADAKDGKSLRVSITLDSRTVQRAANGSVSVQEALSEQDADGKFVAQISDSAKLQWPADQEQARYTRTIPLRSGAVSLRLMVRDAATGRFGSLTISLKDIAIK